MINPEIKQARKRTWKISQLEKATQLRSKYKDRKKMKEINRLFPKQYLFKVDNFYIFEVDGEWVRNNLYAWFRIGGHGRVHLFIPNDEIWIEKNHGTYKYMARTILHEINEFRKMKSLPFYHAHLNSLAEELKYPKKLTKLTERLQNIKENAKS